MATAITEKELMELERRYWQAMKDGDADTAMALTDSPCIVSGAQGVGSFEKKEFAEMFKSPSWKLRSFQLKDGAKMSRIGSDVAILAYEVHEDLTVDGEPVSFDAADCSTWVRKDGSWVCASHSETIEGDAYGRDRAAPPPPQKYVNPYAGEEAYWGSE